MRDLLLGADAGEGERDRTQAEIEQPPAFRRNQVVVPLFGGGPDDLDLRLVEAHRLIEVARPRVLRRARRSRPPRSAGRSSSGRNSISTSRMPERAASDSDCVARTTAQLALRSTFSHSRILARNTGWPSITHASSSSR